MQIVVNASASQKEEWLQKSRIGGAQVQFIQSGIRDLILGEDDIFFDSLFDEQKPEFIKTSNTVFVNAVGFTLKDLPENYIRFNGWNGFLKRNIIEIAVAGEKKEIVETVMNTLNWKYKLVPDIPGMISGRIISMIVNEAYFALQDEVSTKKEIDIAMKLGTNYPYGPFEWSEKIGLEKIFFLLKRLQESDTRYAIANLLSEEADQRNKAQ